MKNLGPILVGVAVALVVGVLTYGVLAKDGAPPQSDEEFLETVRNEGATGSEAGILPPADKADAVPVAVPETDHYDMGLIPGDKISEGGFKVANNGKAPLVISNITTSCGCTKGYKPDQPIAPGEEGFIRVTVDPFRIAGFTSTKTLTIFTNDPKKPSFNVDVSARVEPELEFEPESFDFGPIAKGETAEKKVIVRQKTDQTFHLTAASARGKEDVIDVVFEEAPKEQWKSPDRKEYIVTAKVRPDATQGQHSSVIQIDTDLKRLRRSSVGVNLLIKADYEVTPQVLTLRSIQPGETIGEVLRITSEKTIEDVTIETSNETLQVSKRVGENNAVVFDLVVGDGAAAERLQRDNWKLTIKAGGKEYTETVRVLATVEQPDEAAAVDENPA